MLAKILLIAVVAVVPFSVSAADEKEIIFDGKRHVYLDEYTNKRHVTENILEFNREKYKYYVLDPRSRQKSKQPIPVIIILHGIKDNALWFLNKWRIAATKYDIVIISPEKLKLGDTYLRMILETSKQTPIDLSRVYIFGDSIGGVVALNMMVKYPEYFAAVAVYNSSFWKKIPYSKLKRSYIKTPVAVFRGKNSQKFGFGTIYKTVTAFNKHAYRVKYEEISNLGDNYDFDVQKIVNSKVWGFLRKHHLNFSVEYNLKSEKEMPPPFERDPSFYRLP